MTLGSSYTKYLRLYYKQERATMTCKKYHSPGGNPVESQVVLREKTPESNESLEDNSAKNFDLCRQLLSAVFGSRLFDETFGVSGSIRRLTRGRGDVGLLVGECSFGGLSDSFDKTDCDAGGDVRCDDIDEFE